MTDFAKVITSKREVLVPLATSNFGSTYHALFDKSVASGYEIWLAYSNNNFDNPFQKADEELYNKMAWFGEIFKDKVQAREAKKSEVTFGRLPLMYVANAGTSAEQLAEVLAPKEGWYVPTDDDIFIEEKGIWIPFYEGTLIPHETVDNKGEAKKRLKAKGIPENQVSYFFRLDNYQNDSRFVGRNFYPDVDDCGRFFVCASWFPSFSGIDGVGVRSADEQKIVMNVSAPVRETVETSKKEAVV